MATDGGARAQHTNRLAGEPSPYLRQHAHNPVDWWPWGEAAFAEARRRDVPVFLSVGYATCHWCHVMAHESFEDAEVARLLNDAFVCVKVDREERPDIDDLYMAACQQMTGSGGWPLTVLLTHDRKPFLAGTYFPRESRHGRIGMLELVPRIREAWRTQRPQLVQQAEHILQHVRGGPHGHGDEAKPEGPAQLGLATLERGAQALRRRFDSEHGGFGAQPKFPSPHHVLFLLRMHHRGDQQALEMAVATLAAMAHGGIRDHLGGGFHRYSTDREWLLPHFEKMLYDQAMLALAYTEAFHATGEPLFEEVARETLDYVLRDLADPAGGLRSAEDADSEGVEGKFYVWSLDEVRTLLGPEADVFASAYGLEAQGNFADEATRRPTGANILHLPRPIGETARRLGVGEGELRQRLARCRSILLQSRSRRVRPLLDDKVLTDWNGLAIAALACAGRVLQEPRYTDAALRAARFLRSTMRRPDGRMLHRFHHGRTDTQGFLTDHAFLMWGLVELHAATLDPPWLAHARELAFRLRAHFADPEGGFFLAAADGEALPARRKESYDGALPSGNTAAAYALERLALLTGEPEWSVLADRTLRAFAADIADHPAAFTMGLAALDLAVGPTRELAIAGEGPVADAMVAAARKRYDPRLELVRATPAAAKVAPWLAGMQAPAGGARAYLCEGHACKAPVASAAELEALLEGQSG